MESNFRGSPSPAEAAESLQALDADGARLATTVRVPWTLLAGFGGVAAWWVASAAGTDPGAAYEAPSTSWLALVAALVITYLIGQRTGIRLRSMGAAAGWVITGIVAICLLLFSVSLGLVSFGHHWAVALTSLTAFLATTWLTGVAYRSAIARLHRG